MKTVNIGLIGFGTVGAGVVETIQKNSGLIAERPGARLVMYRIADLDTTSDRGVVVPPGVLGPDAMELIADPAVDIVVELVGGTGVARKFVRAALEAGKPVVTANKALLAKYGAELFALAAEHGTEIYFEASVGGGIPCIKALREGLAANRVQEMYGILNGTCNYILTRMENERADFGDVLAAAQAAGYAEADPAADVDGYDTANKAAILASLAYGHWFTVDDVDTQGIREVTLSDIDYARELGYRIKLLAVIKERGGMVELGVHPSLIPSSSLLGHVDDVFNALLVKGDIVGDTLYYGRGAGRAATSSAVVADIIDIALNLANESPNRLPAFRPLAEYRPIQDDTSLGSRFYIRLQVADNPGVLAQVSGILGTHGISIASVTQKEGHLSSVPMVILTHQASETAMKQAIAQIGGLACVVGRPVIFRLEDLS